MAQDRGYNHDFTEEDAEVLCQLAPLANLPEHHYYTCCWITSQAEMCNSLVQGPEFSEHLRSHHAIGGSEKAQLMCCWINCFTEMKKESLVRHVNEKHLEVKHSCPSCPEHFTRPYTLNKHISRKHSGS